MAARRVAASAASRFRYASPGSSYLNAIQVSLLRRYRGGDEAAVPPLLRSIAGIAAGLRNTG